MFRRIAAALAGCSLVVALVAAIAPGSASAGLLCPEPDPDNPLCVLEFHYETVYQPPDGGPEVRRSTDAVINFPTGIDATGDRIPDFLATLLAINTSGAGLQLIKTNGDALPVRVEAVLTDPRSREPDHRIAFGYDALNSQAPSVVTVNAQWSGMDKDTRIGVDLTTVAPGERLTAVGSTFVDGVEGREDTLTGRATFTPVPRHLGVDLSLGELPQVDLNADVESRVDFDVRRAAGQGRTTTLGGTVDRLPRTAAIAFEPDGAGGKRLRYSSPDVISSIHVQGSNLPLPGRAKHLDATVTGLPTGFSLTLPDGERGFSFNAAEGERIGEIAAAVASGPLPPIASGDHVLLFNVATEFAATARVRGLRSLAVQTTPSIAVDVVTPGGQVFDVDVAHQPDAARAPVQIDGTITRLPSAVHVDVTEERGGKRVHYTASDSIGELRVAARNLVLPDGGPIALPPRHLYARVTNVPPELDVVAPAAGPFELHASRGEIGSAELELTTGAPNPSALQGHGVLLDDRVFSYQLLARVSRLRNLEARPEPADFLLDSMSGAPFTVDIRRGGLPFGQMRSIRARIAALRPNTRVSLRTEPHLVLDYSAEGSAGRLDVDYATNSPTIRNLHADLSALPPEMRLCLSVGPACATSGRTRVDTAIQAMGWSNRKRTVLTPTTLNLSDSQGPGRGMSIRSLTFSKLALDFNTDEGWVRAFPVGHVFIDTDDTHMSGAGEIRLGGYLQFQLAPGFKAQDRIVDFEWPTTWRYGGTITCPDPTRFQIYAATVLYPLHPHLCGGLQVPVATRIV